MTATVRPRIISGALFRFLLPAPVATSAQVPGSPRIFSSAPWACSRTG
jgi:hypothetical protein